MAEVTIYRYANDGESIGILPYRRAEHTEDLDGTDRLTVETDVWVSKRERLVWQDNTGEWHEHMVDKPSKSHKGGRAVTSIDSSNSISELFGIIASGTKLKASVGSILSSLLSGTRWEAGSCSDFGTVEIEVWNKSVRECISELCDMVGGELETDISVDDSKVTRRRAAIVRERGSRTVTRQFSYGRNISGATREVGADEVYTAIIGVGAKIDAENDSEYSPRITVTVETGADVNTWGIPKGDGTFAHNAMVYFDHACTSKAFLARQCSRLAKAYGKPAVSYIFDVAEADDSLWGDVRLGNKVMCVDDSFSPRLELIERVSRIRRLLKGRIACTVEIGRRTNPLLETFRTAERTAKRTTGNGTGGDIGGGITTGGDFPGYDPEAMPDTIPYAIQITTPPTKTEYEAGEEIDYSGIVVTLLTEAGTTYTSEWYPDGTVPFDELTLPVKTAHMDSNGVYGYMYSEELEELGFEQPMVVYSGIMKYITNVRGIGTDPHYWTSEELMGVFRAVLWQVGDDNIYRTAFAARDNIVISSRFQAGDDYRNLDDVKTDVTSTSNIGDYGGHFTRDGNECWYSTGGGSWYNWASLPNHTSGPNVTQEYIRQRVAYAILYGDVEGMFHDNEIPVQWTRSDGEVLTTTFEITVTEQKYVSDDEAIKPYETGPGW